MKRSIAAVCMGLAIAAALAIGGFNAYAGYQDLRISLAKRKAAWAELKRDIKKESAGFNGKIGLIVKDLQTGWVISINENDVFPSASMVKIPIMAACFKAAHEGSLSLDERIVVRANDITSGSGLIKTMPPGSSFSVKELIGLMVTRSDNTAANILIKKLGLPYLNAYFRSAGLRNTNLSRKMMDFQRRGKGVENYTTPKDMSLILENIYRGKCVNAAVSQKCLDILKNQKVKDRIPKRLPQNAVVAHKTGLERRVCHDAGIVFTEQGDFLICVLTKIPAKDGFKPAKRFIAKVAAYTYNSYQE